MEFEIGLIFFQARKELERLLQTIPPGIRIIAVDGRCIGYPDKDELSTDGSRELLHGIGATIIDLPNKMEFEKREAYLRECKKNVLVVVDSDHIMVGNWGLFSSELDKKLNEKNGYLYKMPIYTQGTDAVYRFSYMPLVIYKPQVLHYEERHDKICFNGVQQLPTETINGLMQINNHDLRTQDRIAKGYIFKILSRRMELNMIEKISVQELSKL